MNLVLIGYRGCGKSTVGRALAERLGWPFVDTDLLIEQRAGLTIREIYARHGEQRFRAWESEVIAEVAALTCHVISTGGGLIRSENARLLHTSGKLVYLTAPPEVLWQRIYNDTHRHATRLKMDPDNGLEQVRAAMAERHPIYSRAADITIDTTNTSVPGIVESIIIQSGMQAA